MQEIAIFFSMENKNLLVYIVISLVPGWYGSNFKNMIFKLIIQNDSQGTCCKIAVGGMPQNLIN